MHAIVRYHIPSLFSARMLATNAFSARTLICPTPAMVKMGMLAALLRRDAGARGQEHVDWLAPLTVAWDPPPVVAVSAATVRVWKGDKADVPLIMLAGVREYAHMAEPFGVALLNVPEERQDDASYGLTRLRALGNAESMVQPLGPVVWQEDVPEGFINLADDDTTAMSEGEITAVLDDLGSEPRFERLSAYRENGRQLIPQLGADRVRFMLQLPFQVRRRTANGYVVERVP